jgi:hypothetical protein
MADRPRPDIIASRRDPDRRRSAPWRLLVGLAAAALIAGGIGVQHLLGGSGSQPHHKGHTSLSFLTLAAPLMLHGTALGRGDVPSTALFLGGEDLRLLTIGDRASKSLSDVQLSLGQGSGPLGPDPAVQQVSSVAGGIVALVAGVGSAGLRDLGDVVFIPASASGAGDPRVIARADYIAVAPDHRDIWVEQAGPPWGNGPADSPAWLVDEAGQRQSAVTRLPGRVLVAATVRGLLVQRAFGGSALIGPAGGGPGHDGIASSALIVDADADQVAWQAQSCAAHCPLHVTSLQGGPGTVIRLPAHTAVDAADTADFDPAGQRLALPLDTINRHGVATGTYVYVADIGDRKLIRLPGGPIPLVTLPAVIGAIPAGSTDVVSVRWAADDSGLWIVATDGLYFQVAYWGGTGPLRVLSPQPGLAYKFDIPGPGAPGQ